LYAYLYNTIFSTSKINFPNDVISQGQVLKLKVLKVQNNCIYLGLKQVLQNPWQKIKEKFKDLTKVYEGLIKAINDYELVIDLEDGLTGSIHVSETSWGFKKGSSLADDFRIGQSVKFNIIEIDTNRKKIKLSMKQLLPNPFFEFTQKHKVNDEVEGTILNDHVTFGSFVFVELQNGVDGMLHKSEIDWNPEQGLSKFTDLEKGQKLKVKIINIDN